MPISALQWPCALPIRARWSRAAPGGGTTRHKNLAVRHVGELVVLSAFTGGPEQLWRLDQLADGSWRIMPKAVPNAKAPMALSAIGANSATVSKYDPAGNKHRWLLKQP